VKRVVFHNEATAELDAAIAWYNEQQTGLGLAFHAAVQVVLDRIERDTSSGLASPITPFRFHLTSRFPYAVYWSWRTRCGLPP
jgi:hypothetical protein